MPPGFVKFILELGFSVNTKDGAGRSLFKAALTGRSRNPEVMRILLDHGMEVLVDDLSPESPTI